MRRRAHDRDDVEEILRILSSGGDENSTQAADVAAEGQCVSETAAVLSTCVELLQAGLSIAFVVVLQTFISTDIAAKTTKVLVVKCNYRKEVSARCRKNLAVLLREI
jgi:hypothetical protein